MTGGLNIRSGQPGSAQPLDRVIGSRRHAHCATPSRGAVASNLDESSRLHERAEGAGPSVASKCDIDDPTALLSALSAGETRAPLPCDLETLAANALASRDVRRLKLAARALSVEARAMREDGRREPERLGALIEAVRAALRAQEAV